MSDHPVPAQSAWFLGPRAENADLLERLAVEAIRDHAFWRRNFHPEDGVTIRERDRRSEAHGATAARLTEEFGALLARLKQDLPFFSGRYLGHMLCEQTLAAQAGYLAAMLYNPNNVAAETSPATTPMELEAAEALATMVGYDPRSSWGHLTSGGTLANFEALWIARQIHYLPLAVAGAARDTGIQLHVPLPDGRVAPTDTLSLWQLLNLDATAALDLRADLYAALGSTRATEALEVHSLAARGYQDYTLQLARQYGDTLPSAVVLVAATAHYSWEKIVRALGIGGDRLRYVPIDDRCRMDPDALWAELVRCAESRTPVLALVSVCGTTEESAVDRLDKILQVRERARRELGLTFHLHSDACYGGYAAAVTWGRDGRRLSAAEIRHRTGTDWPGPGLVAAMEALAGTDSISIDPHKLGYVPYAAGAFLLRDRRARELVTLDPPYLEPGAESRSTETERFLGRYSLEGSRPGAAAAATWLSHRVIPLNEDGYGHLIARTVLGARRLHAALTEAELAGARAVLLAPPDLNIVNFLVRPPGAVDLATVNAFTDAVHARLSQRPGAVAPEYYVTKTRLLSPRHDGALSPLLAALGIDRAAAEEGIVVLRMTVMDPWLVETDRGTDHIAGFVRHLGDLCRELLATLPSA